MCAKHYENLTMLSKVTAKNVGDVSFETHCISVQDKHSLHSYLNIIIILHFLETHKQKRHKSLLKHTRLFLRQIHSDIMDM